MPIKITGHTISTETRILELLKKLPEGDGYTYPELSKLLGAPSSQIKDSIYRSEKLLRCKVELHGLKERAALINPKYVR